MDRTRSAFESMGAGFDWRCAIRPATGPLGGKMPIPVSTDGDGDSPDTVEVDALVVGAGAAGMTAALVASLEGLNVLLCEKSAQVGGTTSTSAGTIWVPGTRHGREAGF